MFENPKPFNIDYLTIQPAVYSQLLTICQQVLRKNAFPKLAKKTNSHIETTAQTLSQSIF